MKVLKFGGTSVGSITSILSLKTIVESAAKEQSVIVVVSALGGVTDQLLRISRLALAGDNSWRKDFDGLVERHRSMVQTIITDAAVREALTEEVNELLGELESLYYGVSLIQDLSKKTEDTIVSYGERISSRIVATLIDGAEWKDSRKIIKTEQRDGRHQLCVEMTNELVHKAFEEMPRITLMPGFISRDRETGETTNLGRGGSDYTAAILAAALDAEVLEIWTDVNGFMTADPRVIQGAYTIPELTYAEATELCNFGAKVIYPPTIYPVCVKNIPILIKNTFNPEDPGSIIRIETANDKKPIRGISSIKDVALITVAGLSMVGVIGVNRRIFTSLANNGISVFMVSQASSENSTSIGVREADAQRAVDVLNEEFCEEIRMGAMYPMMVETGLAAVAIVGKNMRRNLGVAGKLFSTLSRSGVDVIAFAQGAGGTNISFIVRQPELSKVLNVIHDSFFLSEYKELNLFICGTGTVGDMLIDQIRRQHDVLMEQARLKLNVVGIASSKHAIYHIEGLSLDNYREALLASAESNTTQLAETIIGMNLYNSVFVDCTASADVAALYEQLLEHNVNVIAANKIAASGPFDTYRRLKHLALTRGVKYLFETNVGAGLPIISTINDLINSGDRVHRIEAVLSGTLNYIFGELSAEVPFSETVRRAKAEGYSEPDPRIDLSGTDVVRKIVILAREAGYELETSDVAKNLFLPNEMFEGSVEEFWSALPGLDADFEKRRQALNGKHWRFVATMEDGKANVALREVGPEHPFYHLAGSNNIVMLTTERYHDYPMIVQGYGAGAAVTAAGVFANIISVANV